MAEYLNEEDMNTGEYISRDLALKQLNGNCLATDCDNYNGVRCRVCAYADAMDFIDAIPAEDVQPVRRGKWEEIEDFDGDSHYGCTACGAEFYLEAGTPSDNEYYYCPHCGADMREPETTKG